MNNKQKNSLYIVYMIIAVVYTLCYLLIPFKKSAATYIVFAFTILSLMASVLLIRIGLKDNIELKSKIYGLPIIRIAYLYPLIQFILSVIIFVINDNVEEVRYWVALLSSLILMALAAIGAIAIENVRDVIVEQDNKVEQQIKKISYFRVATDGLQDLCSDTVLRKKIEKLQDEIRYSDPVSSDATKELEEEIQNGLKELRKMLKEKSEHAADQLDDLINLVKERNRVCKTNK